MAAGGGSKIAMLVRKAEALVFMQLAGSLSAADEALFDLIHPLAESSLLNWMQQSLEFGQTLEYLPIGQPLPTNDPLLQTNYAQHGGGFSTAEVEFRATTVNYVAARGGGEMLQLKNTPVSLTGLRVKEDTGAFAGQAEDAFGSGTELTIGSDFYLDVDDPVNGLSTSGLLYRCGGAWSSEPRSIKVLYYGGWTANQLKGPKAGALKLAAMKVIRANFFEAKNVAKSKGLGPLTSETIGKWSGTYGSQWLAANFSASIPLSVQQDLFSFRNLGRIFGG